jgi:hypothetical protein
LPGNAPDMAPSRRMIQSSYATAIFFGDPVIKSASSPYIQLAITTTGGTAIAGIFQGCYQIPKGQSAPIFTPWFPGSVQSDATALVIDAPGALFRVASGTTTVAISSTAVGNNISWSTGAGGTTFGAGFSTYTVDNATLTNNATAAFTVVDMWSNRAIGNGADNTTPFNWIVVTFNNEAYRAGQTGVT